LRPSRETLVLLLCVADNATLKLIFLLLKEGRRGPEEPRRRIEQRAKIISDWLQTEVRFLAL
jgi:hypothetical protein